MNVTVLYGGPSAEREVSLVSGKSVIEGLQSMGHTVFGSDVSPADLSGLDHPADVIFPVLHGQFGESGELQEILEHRKLKFVGSGSAASKLGMDKARTKRAWEKGGLPTPAWALPTTEDLGLEAIERVGLPCVAKAVGSGSSIDVYLCKNALEATNAVNDLVARDGMAIVEQFIVGPELTVGLLEEEPLAPIRIIPKSSSFFDFKAKYQSKETEHRFDTGLPADVIEHCRDLARKANAIVGARDLARIDIMLDAAHNPYLLEINTLPGFTPRSLLPEAAAHGGIAFGPLVDRLVKRAAARDAFGGVETRSGCPRG